MTRQAGGGAGAERELGAAEAADARVRLSRERCFFKSIFSRADSGGHSLGRKYRVASETDAMLSRDVERKCSSKGVSCDR